MLVGLDVLIPNTKMVKNFPKFLTEINKISRHRSAGGGRDSRKQLSEKTIMDKAKEFLTLNEEAVSETVSRLTVPPDRVGGMRHQRHLFGRYCTQGNPSRPSPTRSHCLFLPGPSPPPCKNPQNYYYSIIIFWNEPPEIIFQCELSQFHIRDAGWADRQISYLSLRSCSFAESSLLKETKLLTFFEASLEN